jgi:hypothetical protein
MEHKLKDTENPIVRASFPPKRESLSCLAGVCGFKGVPRLRGDDRERSFCHPREISQIAEAASFPPKRESLSCLAGVCGFKGVPRLRGDDRERSLCHPREISQIAEAASFPSVSRRRNLQWVIPI